jgi:hypothetical protein
MKQESIETLAKITRHAQDDLKSSWMWNEMILDQWDNEIADLQRIGEICSSAKFARNSARAALDAGLQEMRRRTIQFMAMAKFHFRNDPSLFEAINRLSSKGAGRRAIGSIAPVAPLAQKACGINWDGGAPILSEKRCNPGFRC